MKCKGNFKYKGLQKRDGGVFKNNKGEEIQYKESYVIKADEETENGIYERSFKIPVDSPLVKDLKDLELYTDIEIEFNVRIYGSRISVTPISVNY